MQLEVQTHRGLSWAELEAIQDKCVDKAKKRLGGTLLASEPQATYTYGRSARPEDLLVSPANVAHVAVSRGGKWTYHGPGQILIYPIVALEEAGYRAREVRRFVENLRIAVQKALSAIEVETTPKDCPYGLFVDNQKIASFGVAIEQGVCRHGTAIYYSNQQEPFSQIHPCGIPGQEITSLQQQGVDLDWEAATRQILDNVKNYFCQS